MICLYARSQCILCVLPDASKLRNDCPLFKSIPTTQYVHSPVGTLDFDSRVFAEDGIVNTALFNLLIGDPSLFQGKYQNLSC
jgi:hypothetical protein